MIDTTVQGSAGWWLQKLARQLQDRNNGRSDGATWNRRMMQPTRVRPGLLVLSDYFDGDPPLDSVSERFREHFREIVRMGRLNAAALVVEAKANRMQLRDFRTAAVGDELGDSEARNIMRANRLQLVARDVHEGMLSLGDSYTIVTPPWRGRTYPLITAEDATQVITAHDPATGDTLAGLKMFRDDANSGDVAYVYLPGRVFVARKDGRSGLTTSPFQMSKSWTWDDAAEQRVPDNRIPVTRFRNHRGKGEFEPHMDTLDRLNRLITKGMVIAETQAHKQMAVKGLPTEDAATGEEIDYDGAFVASPGVVWEVPEGVEFWESGGGDLIGIRGLVKDTLEHLAAVTSTPLHTVTPDAASGSAEGASLMREEHVYAVEDRRDRAAAGWAQTLSNVFAFMGDSERADVTQIEPLYGPVERFSLSEKGSAAAQMKGILPTEAIYTDVLQYPPAEVPNLRSLRGRDLIFQPPAVNSGRPVDG